METLCLTNSEDDESLVASCGIVAKSLYFPHCANHGKVVALFNKHIHTQETCNCTPLSTLLQPTQEVLESTRCVQSAHRSYDNMNYLTQHALEHTTVSKSLVRDHNERKQYIVANGMPASDTCAAQGCYGHFPRQPLDVSIIMA